VLNVPWHPTKSGKIFSALMVFLGFFWDLERRRVALTEPKRLKYEARMTALKRCT
jgi:hypothetical protein